MVLNSGLSSPHLRTQNTPFTLAAFPKQFQARYEVGNWSALFQRHRFLLTALVILAVLCTIYLYYAITLGAGARAGSTGLERLHAIN